MGLAAIAIDKRAVTYFVIVLVLIGGIAAFFNLGQLEDPAFTVKSAVIVTPYPGASPEEVELEITDRIEVAIQEMKQVDHLRSISRAGLSSIAVDIKPTYWADRLPQVFDELRRKIRDVEPALPPGAGRPDVVDDFGDVFGLLLAVTGEGYSYGELERYAKSLKKELSLVDGVARVELWGVQDKVIFLDVSQTQLTQLGLTTESFVNTLKTQNTVVDAGGVDLQDRRFRIAPTGAFRSPEDIGDLTIRPTLLAALQDPSADAGRSDTSELIRIRDIGTVRRGYREPPTALMRFNGEPALGIAITNVSGVNIVDIGRAVDARIEALMAELPIGIELHRVHWQSDVVAEAVKGFLVNFAEAVGIVLVVLALFMGWRLGMIIGTALVATILGSFILLSLFGIDLQRMSLGALVIALGMMVDNAIVVADGFVVRVQRGMERKQAAIEAASQPAWPLLGATVVAVMAFYPIFASVEDVGEYCRTLFTVVAISLLISWVVSVTITPLQCIDMLPAPKSDGDQADPYGGGFYRRYRGVLGLAIRLRFLTIGGLVILLAGSIVGFGQVRQLFFPDSSMPKFMIDYWAPEGTRIEQVAADIAAAEAKLGADSRVSGVAAFIGAGPPRFYLPVEPEKPYASYAQLIVNVRDFRDVPGLMSELDPWFGANHPNALVVVRPYGVGPSNTWKFEVRISGPAVADAGVLRALAGEVAAVLEAEPLAAYARTDWRQRVQKVVPAYSQERARWASVTRVDLANATKRAFDGLPIGLYREQDDLIPIVLRHVEEERQNVGGLDVVQIQPVLSTKTVPLSQVTDSVRTAWEDPLIWRRDRRRTITVQGNPIPGVTLPTLRAAVLDRIEAIALPPGYRLEWGGEYEGTVDAQKSLIPGVLPGVAVMALIVVGLFNAFRPPLVILFTLPFAVIGISAGLLATGTPFGFMALLGAMSLSGMMIKNAIVLLDEINLNLAAGRTPYESVVEAGVSRLRPVALAAATTVLGVIPLLQDVFWVGLAVTIMAGLTFGTVLTMIAVPVLYATLYRLPSPRPDTTTRAVTATA
jgi:multidrug efflux pump subunit AcrB